jgi:hypothetical protein
MAADVPEGVSYEHFVVLFITRDVCRVGCSWRHWGHVAGVAIAHPLTVIAGKRGHDRASAASNTNNYCFLDCFI